MPEESKVPEWALKKAAKFANDESTSVCGRFWGNSDTVIAFARYIAVNEDPPVDPLLVEARKVLASLEHPVWADRTEEILAGKRDHEPAMDLTLAALRRGVEIGKGGDA